MISVVIPYMEQLAQGIGDDKELKYAIRSFEKHCQFEFNIVIVGDRPSWYKGTHIPTDKVRGMQFARCFDIANKLNTICHSPAITDDFIYTYDDVYCLTDLTLDDFKKVVAVEYLYRNTKHREGSVNYQRLMEGTIKAVNQDQLFNYETHLPRVLNKQKLALIYRAYNLKQRPLLFSTLYFNELYDKPDVILSDNNEIKAAIGTKLPYNELLKKTKGFKWLNHSENAYNEGMKKFLAETFKNKSRFEK